MTKGPPLAIGSPIGFPDINKNLDLIIPLTLSLLPLVSKIRVELITFLCFLSPILISPSIK